MKQLLRLATALALLLSVAPRLTAQAFLDRGAWEYTHTSNRGNKCVFVWGNKDRRGSADYVWNGRRLKEELKYEKWFRENGVSYMVYRVVNKDRWFVFAGQAVKSNGKDDYQVFFSSRSPNKIGDCTLTTTNVTSVKQLKKLRK